MKDHASFMGWLPVTDLPPVASSAALHLSMSCSCNSVRSCGLSWGARLGGLEGAQRVALRLGEEAGRLQAAAALRGAQQAHLQAMLHYDKGL